MGVYRSPRNDTSGWAKKLFRALVVVTVVLAVAAYCWASR